MLKYCRMLPSGRMRPEPYTRTDAHFECVECGARVQSPSSRVCSVCEGTLLNLSVPRDA